MTTSNTAPSDGKVPFNPSIESPSPAFPEPSTCPSNWDATALGHPPASIHVPKPKTTKTSGA